jgi:hypothetical protein
MKHSPHLPPKSCSVPLHKRLRLVESIIFVTALAFISGLVGGIISDVYITPEYDAYTGVIQNKRVITQTVQQTPDPLFVREQYRRMLFLSPRAVYEKTGYVSPDTVITAVLLTDTGWFVVPTPTKGINAKSWVAVTAAGEAYNIESIVLDKEQGLVYGSLDGEGFRVASFPFLDSFEPGRGIWISKNGTLERSTLAYPSLREDILGTYRPGESSYVFKPLDSAPSGAVVWTEGGEFFGFVNKEGAIKPWYVVKSVYTNVFTEQPIAHDVLPVQGYAVALTEEESAIIGGRYGFYIESVDSGITEIAAGDVIVGIEDNPLVPWILEANVLLHNGESIIVRVLTGGDVVEKILEKI